MKSSQFFFFFKLIIHHAGSNDHFNPWLFFHHPLNWNSFIVFILTLTNIKPTLSQWSFWTSIIYVFVVFGLNFPMSRHRMCRFISRGVHINAWFVFSSVFHGLFFPKFMVCFEDASSFVLKQDREVDNEEENRLLTVNLKGQNNIFK